MPTRGCCWRCAASRRSRCDEHRGEKPEDEGAARNAAQRGEQQDERREETAVRAQQVTDSAEPAKEGGNGEAVEWGYPVRCMSMPDLSAMRHMKVSVAREVKVARVGVAAREKGEHTEQKAQDEADEIEQFPRHVISPNGVWPVWHPRML